MPCDAESLETAWDAGGDPTSVRAALDASCDDEVMPMVWAWIDDYAPPDAESDLGAVLRTRWTEVCPDGPSFDEAFGVAPVMTQRRAVAEACGLESMGVTSVDDVVFASGWPLHAPLLGAWLTGMEIPSPTVEAMVDAARGQRVVVHPPEQLTTWSDGAKALEDVRVELTLTPGQLAWGEQTFATGSDEATRAGDAPWGVFETPEMTWDRWALASVPASDDASPWMAVGPGVSWDELRRVVMSLGGAGTTVRLVGADPEGAELRWREVTLAGADDTRPRLRVTDAGVTLYVGDEAPAREACGATWCRDDGAAWDGAAVLGLTEGDVQLEAEPWIAAEAMLSLVDVLAAGGRSVAVAAPTEQRCAEASAGMVCVPGGPVRVGETEVSLPTFYLDADEVSVADYQSCAEAGVCEGRRFGSAMAAANGLTWRQASRYCSWAGKRLPTEWEWAKAAGGPDGMAYPWGAGEPTCDLAHTKGCYAGERAAQGPYGLHDLVGGVSEWTGSWYRDLDTCGEACFGRDPLGPCDGIRPCSKASRRVVKGGSFEESGDALMSHERASVRATVTGSRYGVRCASDTPYTMAWPARATTTKNAGSCSQIDGHAQF